MKKVDFIKIAKSENRENVVGWAQTIIVSAQSFFGCETCTLKVCFLFSPKHLAAVVNGDVTSIRVSVYTHSPPKEALDCQLEGFMLCGQLEEDKRPIRGFSFDPGTTEGTEN